jgi:NAD(P)H dehydrogenase (quinone)
MKTLVIVAHPNPASFNVNGILKTVTETLAAKGHDVRVRDLYALDFNPVLSGADFAAFQSGNIPEDIKTEQAHIAWATNIVVINPTWWIGRPAILQGYYDRVFSYGFAFEVGPDGPVGLLKNEKALVINTAGTAEAAYDAWEGSKALLGRPSTEGVFYFSGIKHATHLQLFGIGSSTDAQRADALSQVADAVNQL